MSSSFWLLGVESRDFSHAEKERTACKAEPKQPKTRGHVEHLSLTLILLCKLGHLQLQHNNVILAH